MRSYNPAIRHIGVAMMFAMMNDSKRALIALAHIEPCIVNTRQRAALVKTRDIVRDVASFDEADDHEFTQEEMLQHMMLAAKSLASMI